MTTSIRQTCKCQYGRWSVILIPILFIYPLLLCAFWLLQPEISEAGDSFPCLKMISGTDSLLVADAEGRILCGKNETEVRIPASTLKLLTALAAIDHFGRSYRFRTEFYLDSKDNLKIKGYGDPLLISEVWQDIADTLSKKVRTFKDMVLDDTYFSGDIRIPGTDGSTNPYDAPCGALCANFNTIFFKHDQQGRIVSAEPQTPMILFAVEKVRQLGLDKGRYTFTHEKGDITRYAGELLLYLLTERGVKSTGMIRLGRVNPADRLIYTYYSRFRLEDVIGKMMEFSNNFMANQIFLALGAHVYGPPGTLSKGIRSVSMYGRDVLGLKDIRMVEGSGVSRENRITAIDMLRILKRFMPYRHLLKKRGGFLFKSGTLEGIRTRAGYVEENSGRPHMVVVFLNGPGYYHIDSVMKCIKRALTD